MPTNYLIAVCFFMFILMWLIFMDFNKQIGLICETNNFPIPKKANIRLIAEYLIFIINLIILGALVLYLIIH